jgi:hypothetical protein
MKDKFELEVDATGKITTIYQSGIEQFAKELGGEIVKSSRASNIEWETIDGVSGWVVRAAHNPNLAIKRHANVRMSGVTYTYHIGLATFSQARHIAVFETREEALKYEEQFFWELLERKQ